ncbi:hypothetical protein [Deinococcus sp. AJ005]|uniref:hypothetical protein n=1 Tax=Deinococcus sp. AJ005 TaxID=2652443 RepID=UPI00125CA998|nr:hypothetical protein [Deinococcus sp. AJ005]QFP76226.1 hypothetical protein DAAJ005_06995 [Deinococcus sp. AJ005]
MAYEVSFQPSYDQFVLYDPHAPPNPEEAPLWDSPAEQNGLLSIRNTQLAVSCWDERDWTVTLFVGIEVFPGPPSPPLGEWPFHVEAALTVASGVLAVGDIMLMETPALCVPVPSGRVRLRIAGQPNPESGQRYVIQVWPES